MDTGASPSASSYDSDSDRDNLFSGPAKNWLGYIKEEKDLADSLDREQANNLSLHLYNAHAIKAIHHHRRRDLRSWQHRHLWLQGKPDEPLPWVPPQAWTAWPMNAEDVPRPEERHGNLEALRNGDAGTLKMAESWYPSLDLEDEIMALLLREAKEAVRFDVDGKGKSRHKGVKDVAASSTEDSGSSSATSFDDSLSSQQESMLEEQLASPQTPQLIDDDQHAREILLPSARHILSGLDDLLLALHKSRAPQKTVSSQACTTTALPPMKRKRTSTGAGKEAKVMKLSNAEHDSDLEKAQIELPDPPPRQHKYTRDWSEVLGLASMAGLDRDVIARTRARCSRLFGEDMTMAIDADEVDEKMTVESRVPSRTKEQPGRQTDYIGSVLDELSQFGRHISSNKRDNLKGRRQSLATNG